METITLQEVIRQFVQLPSHPNSHGWYSVVCKVCNDHNKKGPRAGFHFDGPSVGYNCFNCGHTAAYDPSTRKPPSKEMVEVLNAFNIPETEWKKAGFDALIKNYQTVIRRYLLPQEPPEISLPLYFYPLTDDKEDDWCQYSIEYLTNRKINWQEYPFYCVKKMDHPDNKRWYGRLIIPFFKDGRLIFYQGRDLTDLHKRKYLSLNSPRDNILYGYEYIDMPTSDPLFVVEGWFDAYSINGVATLGNRLTQQQISWLNRSNRPKVIIPDRYGDGHLLAKQAIDLGWSISTLDRNDDCKDINESIIKRGKLYTMTTIMNNIISGNLAQSVINIYCEEATKHGKHS